MRSFLSLLSLGAVSASLISEQTTCDVAVVGGGWAGVYFAWRQATSSEVSVCLFEANSRIGGRTYSVPIDGTDFILDVGAYRFSPDMHLPGDLIMKHFDLPTECYEPGCPPAYDDFVEPFMFNYTQPLRRIVNETTRLPAGYVTAINAMVEEMSALPHVTVLTDTPVADVVVASDKGGETTLVLGDGTEVTTETTMLNLPRNKLFDLPSVVGAMTERARDMLQCVVFDMPESLFQIQTSLEPSSALSKVYLLYSDAWWITKLNQTEGTFPAGDSFLPVPTSSGIWINVHWNDGPTMTSLDENGNLQGFLEIYYDITNETFFSSTPANAAEDPLGVLWADESEDAAQKLTQVHSALLEAIAGIFNDAGVDPSAVDEPEAMVVGAWGRPSEEFPLGNGYTAPTKVYFAPEMSGNLAAACGVSGLTEDEYRATALMPFSEETSVYMANNDYVAQNVYYMFGDWAEESLLMAERALSLLGVEKPAWLDAAYYEANVIDRL